jgi:hypothetical protein
MENEADPSRSDQVPTPSARELERAQLLAEVERINPIRVVDLYRDNVAPDELLQGVTRGMVRDDIDSGTLDAVIEALPQRNLDQARAVYTAFARSPINYDRVTAARFVSALTPVDHDYGMKLWFRLIRDPHPQVRWQACKELDELFDRADFTGIDAELSKKGISYLDACRLLHAYILAGQHPGETIDLDEELDEE